MSMDPKFLEFYNRELQYIREMGSEFAQEFPKIAGRLGLESFECSDPYVERLLEGFAFLSARVHLKLDAEFPKFCRHLFEIVYPHYLCPTPSMVVAQFHPDLTEGSLAKGYVVPRHTTLRSLLGPGDQTACEYRTAHDTTLWPLQLVEAEYFNREAANLPLPPRCRSARAGIRLKLRTTAGVKFSELALDRLTLHVRGRTRRAMQLYEQVFADVETVLIRTVGGEWLNVDAPATIARVGFDDGQALLPVVPEAFQGYRLLHEYFAFPPRYLFFALGRMAPALRRAAAAECDVVILLKRSEATLENVVDAENFALNCTPAVNLFPHRADRIHLNDRDPEFHVVPDRTRPLDLEVYQVTQVTGYGEDDAPPVPFRAFYSMSDPVDAPPADQTAYYTTHRAPRVLSARQKRSGPRSSYVGSEVFLALVDAREVPHAYGLSQLDVSVLCTNRDLPLSMPVGKAHTDFTLDIGAPVTSVRCVAGPTEPLPSHGFLSGGHVWRLINHLSLNYLSLVDDEGRGATALREMLKLYADVYEAEQRKQVDGVRSIASKPITRRLPGDGPLTFGRGLEITLTCDESAFEGSGAFLIGSVLAEFFTRYVSINSFTETVLRTTERGEVMRWPASIGKRRLI